MAVRVGIDLTSVSQVADAIDEHGDHYLTRVYTAREVEDCRGPSGVDAARLAARFAVKEATRKVLGIADGGVGWTSIEVVRHPASLDIRLSGAAADLADAAGLTSFAVSVTHEEGLAAAVVVAEGASPH
jgi:holo-[acyl-carrier protein] synthase